MAHARLMPFTFRVNRDDFVNSAPDSGSTPLRLNVCETMLPYCLMMFVVGGAITNLSYRYGTCGGTSLNALHTSTCDNNAEPWTGKDSSIEVLSWPRS